MLVEIPDEIYAELKRMGEALKTQDNRITADPYFFQVQDKKKVWGISSEFDHSGFAWIDPNRDEALSESVVSSPEYKDRLIETIMEYELDVSYCSDIEDDGDYFYDKPEEDILLILRSISISDLEAILRMNEYEKAYYRSEEVLANCFFDEKSIKDHIKSNRHHYTSEVNDYISYAYRNPDMEAIIKFLRGL
jgi:hypothetical protein